MKNNDIEKNFKNKLESYESFEGDKMAMWANIDRELDEKKERKFIWFWLFPILLGILGASWYIFGKNQSTVIEHTSTNNISQQDTYSDIDSKKDTDNKLNSKNERTKKTENNTFTGEQEIAINKNKSSETKTIQQQQIENNNSSKLELKLFNTTSLSSDISNKREQDLTNSKELVQVKPEKEESKILKKELAVQYLPVLESPFLGRVDDVPVIDTVMLWKASKDKKSPWSIRLGGGVNSMTTGFNNSSTFGEVHLQTLSPQLGWNFIFELEKTFSKDMYLTSGVHFNRNWLRFNYNSTISSQVVLNDIVIRYDINLSTGDTTFISGDTTLSRVTTRDIQHHNQYDKLKIPILMGKRWRDNRFSYGGAVGIGLDFWLKQSGRYLSEDEFGFYDSNTEGTELPKLGWSAEVRGDFGFEINKKINLFAQPYLSVALKNWSIIGDGAIQKPMVFGSNFGLQIKF